jgi:hypothetical protein
VGMFSERQWFLLLSACEPFAQNDMLITFSGFSVVALVSIYVASSELAGHGLTAAAAVHVSRLVSHSTTIADAQHTRHHAIVKL